MPEQEQHPDQLKEDQNQNIDEEIIIEPIKKDIHFIEQCLTMSENFIRKAPALIKTRNISEETAQRLAKEAIVDNLCQNKLSREMNMPNIYIIQEVFNLPQETVQEYIKKAIANCLSRGIWEQVEKIQIYFKELPEEILHSPELQQAAKEGILFLLSMRHDLLWESDLNNAIIIKRETALPEEILYSQEIQQAAEEAIVRCLCKRDLDSTKILIQEFTFSEEIIQRATQNVIIELLKNKDIKTIIYIISDLQIKNIIKGYLASLPYNSNLIVLLSMDQPEKYFEKEYLDSLYQQFVDKIEDQNLKNQFILLQTMVGETKLKNILIGNEKFWENIHDSLLFVEKITSLPEEKQLKVANLVIKPLLSKEADFQELNELLGYFDVDIYIAKKDGEEVPFNNWQEFIREANLQRYDIKIPENASDNFKDAMELFISTKGIDVPFLRILADKYSLTSDQVENQDGIQEEVLNEDEEWGDNYEDEENLSSFARQLIEIIEDRDDIDSRKMIAPWETSMPFDPVHRLVYTSVGLHSLNSLTPGFTEFSKDRNGLGAIVSLLETQDKETAKKLRERRDEKTKSNPEKKDRHQAEFAKELANSSFIRKKAGGEVEGIAIENCTDLQYRLGEDQYDLVKQALRIALDSQISVQTKEGEKIISFKDQLIRSLTTLSSRREAISNVIDLIKFEELAIIGEKITKLIEEKSGIEISGSELFDLLDGKEVETALFSAYLGLNNRKRFTESRQIKKELDQILNQQRYKEKNQKLKDQNEVDPKNDVFLSYINGKINLEKVDEERVKEVLSHYGYDEIGRTLNIEIAKGSDYQAWVCGDKTDCCMPFTSGKNQEYLLRDDLSYFVVSIEDENGDEDLVAQSVLVAAEELDGTDIIAIDNIEIANRTIKYRPIIIEAYHKLREELAARYKYIDEPFKIVIGTSYNDDGGLMTGECELVERTAKPQKGKMRYSDWYEHGMNMV